MRMRPSFGISCLEKGCRILEGGFCARTLDNPILSKGACGDGPGTSPQSLGVWTPCRIREASRIEGAAQPP